LIVSYKPLFEFDGAVTDAFMKAEEFRITTVLSHANKTAKYFFQFQLKSVSFFFNINYEILSIFLNISVYTCVVNNLYFA
jgi:hypothetical protein